MIAITIGEVTIAIEIVIDERDNRARHMSGCNQLHIWRLADDNTNLKLKIDIDW